MNKFEIQWDSLHRFLSLCLPLQKNMLQSTLSDFNFQIKTVEHKSVFQDLFLDE